MPIGDILNNEHEIINDTSGFLKKIDTDLDKLLKNYKTSDEVIIKYIELKENVYVKYIENLFSLEKNNKDCDCRQNIANLDRAQALSIANNEITKKYQNSYYEAQLLQARASTESANGAKIATDKLLTQERITLTQAQKSLADRERVAYDDDNKKTKAQFLGDVASSAISVDSDSKANAIVNFNNAINAIV